MKIPLSDSLRAAAHEVAALLRPGQRVCLTTHVNPDGDGLGSEVAMIHLLRSEGIDAIITNPTATPERFGFLFADLPGVDCSRQAIKELRRADLVIVLDIADLSRLGNLGETVRERGVPVICLDHHVGPGDLPDGPRFVDVTAAATGELVFFLARELGWQLTPAVARALYVALVTDTGGFRFSNTRPRTLHVAAELLAAGVDTEQTYLDVYANAPIGRPRLLAEVLQTLVVEDELGLAWVTVAPGAIERHGVDADDLDGVVEHARSVRGVRLALLFRPMSGGRVKVSFRSVGEVNVSALARHFHGGGHTKAAGAAIPGGLDEVQQMVLEAARSYLASGVLPDPATVPGSSVA
ncbi:MAG: bifunctional oligoribonuclease/PAP phosphatase NrnA [Gemmatimonadales bacterium]|jgi:phosphoesterase RecJ-like protein|nr:bifunctional oligoribonuclease/PAP phosphatase NrnA [Gemmatimonadales bacterium]MDZ4390933.1 bifunctional oligoribonuclease/PAP phosphatase NrnA [Gemmatimonadales bacterium]